MTVYDPPNPSCPIHGACLQRSTCAKCNAAYMRRYLKVQRRVTPAVALHSRARQRAARRGLPFDLDVSDVVVPSICPALGVPLVIGEMRSPYSMRSRSMSATFASLKLIKVGSETCVIFGRRVAIKPRMTAFRCSKTP